MGGGSNPPSDNIFMLFASRLIKKDENCRDPGLNQGPSDLQSDALPTELSRLYESGYTDSIYDIFD